MFIHIVCNRSGETELLRRLAPNENIDPRHHAAIWAESVDCALAPVTGYIPRGCGDFYAETRDRKTASAHCWDSFDFYLDAGDSL